MDLPFRIKPARQLETGTYNFLYINITFDKNQANKGILHSQVYTFFRNGVYYRIENRMPKLEI